MKKIIKNVILVLAATLFVSCEKIEKLNYAESKNWAFMEPGGTTKKADVFFLAPDVFMSPGKHNMSLDYSMNKSFFTSTVNMAKGIFDTDARFFAPFYREVELYEYVGLSQSSSINHQKYIDIAYSDVKEAFTYYLKHFNEYRPLVLAGSAQGGDMCLRLIRDFADNDHFKKIFIACYAIGSGMTEEQAEKYPELHFAQGETDTGVIISYMCEAENFTDRVLVKDDGKIKSINPLNWKTDSTPAPKSMNKGSCFANFDGELTKEVKRLTGCYIDENRGTLKVPDVSVEEYPPLLAIFLPGNYHVYNYQFFYRNLQENVSKRIDAFFAEDASEPK